MEMKITEHFPRARAQGTEEGAKHRYCLTNEEAWT